MVPNNNHTLYLCTNYRLALILYTIFLEVIYKCMPVGTCPYEVGLKRAIQYLFALQALGCSPVVYRLSDIKRLHILFLPLFLNILSCTKLQYIAKQLAGVSCMCSHQVGIRLLCEWVFWNSALIMRGYHIVLLRCFVS